MANESNEKEGQEGEKFVVVPGGLTETEFEIMMHLARAWEKLMTLETDIQARSAFLHGLTQAQRVVGMRVLNREYPKFGKGV